jgi:integrase/recombinase XerD
MKNKIVSPTQTHYLGEYRRFLLMRNYAETTIKSYMSALNLYWSYCEKTLASDPQFDRTKLLGAWFWHVTQKYGAGTFYNQSFSSLKLFYIHILNKDWSIYAVLRPRRRVRPLPDVMRPDEVDALIAHAGNLKHQTILLMLYGTGLRVAELAQLKVADVDSQTRVIHVRTGKGGKDRFVPLTNPLLAILRQYYVQYRPAVFLFYGEQNGKPLSTRTIQSAFAVAKLKAGLSGNISPHSLRHAFATHHIDDGTHLMAIKSMLGHTNIKTTARYIHTSVNSLQQFNNPADDLCKKYTK